jgi:hypothetical protein
MKRLVLCLLMGLLLSSCLGEQTSEPIPTTSSTSTVTPTPLLTSSPTPTWWSIIPSTAMPAVPNPSETSFSVLNAIFSSDALPVAAAGNELDPDNPDNFSPALYQTVLNYLEPLPDFEDFGKDETRPGILRPLQMWAVDLDQDNQAELCSLFLY